MRIVRYDIVMTFRRDSQKFTMKSSTVQCMVQSRSPSLVREYAAVIGKQASCFVVFQLVTLIESVFFIWWGLPLQACNGDLYLVLCLRHLGVWRKGRLLCITGSFSKEEDKVSTGNPLF